MLHLERLAPRTVRVTAGGPGCGALRLNDFTDKYAKIIFADPALGLTPGQHLYRPQLKARKTKRAAVQPCDWTASWISVAIRSSR